MASLGSLTSSGALDAACAGSRPRARATSSTSTSRNRPRSRGAAVGRCTGEAERDRRKARGTGYAFVHSAIDAHSRLAYSEVHDNEQATTNLVFWRRAKAFFASYGIAVERVLTDNGSCYRAKEFDAELARASIAHSFTRPYRPQTNGKAERYNRTLLNEWAYARPYRSEAARTPLCPVAPHVQPSSAPHSHRRSTR